MSRMIDATLQLVNRYDILTSGNTWSHLCRWGRQAPDPRDAAGKKLGVSMSSVLLSPVEKRTLTDIVTERLISFLRSGDLRPGDLLPSQHELARQLGVSRPVLREAMQGLASIGIVEIRPGSGCYVRDPHVEDQPEALFEAVTHEAAIELLEARMVVEVELAGLAATRATVDDMRAMERILAKIKRTVSRGQPTSAVTSDFHTALSRAGRNRVLLRMTQMMARPRQAQGTRVEHALPDIGAGEYASHLLLYQAVATRDPETARAAMREHLETAHGWEERIAMLRRAMVATQAGD